MQTASLVRQLRVPPSLGNGMPDIDDDHDLEHSGHGTGFLRTWRSDHVVATVSDAEFRQPRRQRLEVLGDVLLLRASCSGDCRYTLAGGASWHYRTAAVTLDAIPRGTLLDIDITAGVRQQSMTVLLDPHSLLGVSGEELPEPLRRACEAPADSARQLLSMPISPAI